MQEEHSKAWAWVFVPVIGLVAYQLSMGPMLWWEQRATTKAQFRSRQLFRARASVPLRWAQDTDPTKILSAIHYRYMGLWMDMDFSAAYLPDE